ncbi:hypothetical protein [Kumtagia ephedrae]|jgi:hypothetical protein|uniref:DUF2065 domain-containing protein n=1 Tax=Kumtagia ephedrae TaxID=2116701 RepID=A0A2P7ST11_9HYPH|nr:hypothetical protein [Mesorhizobium ephedrae]PSJ65629.1 hypothetical protein C7I84_00420 [Mesorhizobium ephedrae]
MELTIYLSKVFGIALIAMGASIMLRRRYFVPVFGAFVRERLLRAVMSFIELLGGLFLIVGHTAWSPLPAAIISLLGWVAVIEALCYLLLPDEAVEGMLDTFNKPSWYVGGGLVSILIGVYLAGFGFGLW